MAELDAVLLYNPTSEDFVWNYNGEPYSIKAGETKPFAKFVAFHLAKHLSSQMISEELEELKKKLLKKKEKVNETVMSQKLIYDNPERRIALHKILGNKELVEQVIAAYPFKGFIGEMSLYEQFIAGLEGETNLSAQGATA